MKTTGYNSGKRVYRYFIYLRNNIRGVLQSIFRSDGKEAGRAEKAIGGENGGTIGPDAPRGADQSRILLSWPDRYYLVGTPELYNTVREAFKRQGLEYDGAYFRTASDNGQRVFGDLKTN
jgi:hypothetical protein